MKRCKSRWGRTLVLEYQCIYWSYNQNSKKKCSCWIKHKLIRKSNIKISCLFIHLFIYLFICPDQGIRGSGAYPGNTGGSESERIHPRWDISLPEGIMHMLMNTYGQFSIASILSCMYLRAKRKPEKTHMNTGRSWSCIASNIPTVCHWSYLFVVCFEFCVCWCSCNSRCHATARTKKKNEWGKYYSWIFIIWILDSGFKLVTSLCQTHLFFINVIIFKQR